MNRGQSVADLRGFDHVRHPHLGVPSGTAQSTILAPAQPDRRAPRLTRRWVQGDAGKRCVAALERHRSTGKQPADDVQSFVEAAEPGARIDARGGEFRGILAAGADAQFEAAIGDESMTLAILATTTAG
jgi:hypothetical protein